MRRSRAVAAVLAAGGLAVAGCSAPGPAEITFYADGHTVRAAPIGLCDLKTGKCTPNPSAAGTLKARAGKPVQISVPGELAKSLWKVTVQSVDGNGEPLPLKQDLITSQDRYAYTATPPTPDSRIVVVEVAQGAAFSATGNPDDVQTVTKALWSLQVQPG
ncbi:MAG TPA: DUF2771 family protein [Amycolatopsis sp.]|nr:DUF2771 family protein [Amycolatopsis sp.]